MSVQFNEVVITGTAVEIIKLNMLLDRQGLAQYVIESNAMRVRGVFDPSLVKMINEEFSAEVRFAENTGLRLIVLKPRDHVNELVGSLNN